DPGALTGGEPAAAAPPREASVRDEGEAAAAARGRSPSGAEADSPSSAPSGASSPRGFVGRHAGDDGTGGGDEPPDGDGDGGGDAPPAPPLSGRPRHRQRRLARPEEAKPPLTPEQRLLALDAWQRSGLPAGDFAPLVGLSKFTLYAWKKKFDQEGPAGLM